MITIPDERGQVTQSNRSDVLGNISSSFNLDLTSSLGKVKVSPRMLKVSDTTSLATLTGPASNFKTFNGGTGSIATWTIAGASVLYNNSYPNGTWNTDNGTGLGTVSSDYGDLAILGGNLYVAADIGLYKRTIGTTTYTSLLGIFGGNHMMCVYSGRVYVIAASGSAIYSTDGTATASSGNFTNAVNNETINWLVAGSDRIWYGTYGYNGENGKIYEWDGYSTGATRAYYLDTRGSLACFIKDNVPYVVDSEGRLLVQSNGYFKELDRFPLDYKIPKNAIIDTNNRFIHPHGMTVVNGKLNFLINNLLGDNAGSIPERCPSGIWELDDNGKLYHKQSLTYTPIGSATITDYGQNRISKAGALVNMRIEDSSASANGRLQAGATIYTNGSSTTSAIFTDDTNDTVQKYGYFITSKELTPNLYEMWQKVYIAHRKFLNSADKIVVKYRVIDQDPTEMTITWVNTTSFTTTDVNMVNYAVGDEVEVTQGTGGGLTSHITAIVNASGTYTVTVGETYTGATGTAKARFQKWIKLGSMTNLNQLLEELTIGVPATWIQLKVCMLFTGKDELHKLLASSKPNLFF